MKIFVYGKIQGEFTDEKTGEVIQYYKICAVKPPIYCESRKGFEIYGSDVVRISCNRRVFDSFNADNTNCRGFYYNAEFNEHGKLVGLEPLDKSKNL